MWKAFLSKIHTKKWEKEDKYQSKYAWTHCNSKDSFGEKQNGDNWCQSNVGYTQQDSKIHYLWILGTHFMNHLISDYFQSGLLLIELLESDCQKIRWMFFTEPKNCVILISGMCSPYVENFDEKKSKVF